MSRPRILVVDDDAFVRRPLQFLLEKSGFEAVTATDGVECMARIAEAAPDLICLDVMMPRKDGFATCEEIRRTDSVREVPIIMLTAKGQDSDRVKGLDLGANEFVSKPYSPNELIEKIKALLAQRGR